VSKIREDLLRYGLRVPEVSIPVHVGSSFVAEYPKEAMDGSVCEVCRRMTKDNALGMVVHSAAATSVQALQNSDTPKKGVAVESEEVKDRADVAADDRGFYLGMTKQVCSTFKNIEPAGKPSDAVHAAKLAQHQAEQNVGHETDGGLNRKLTSVDSQRACQPQVKGPTGSWTWRNWSYNRVPPAIEDAIYERFGRGWSKSKLAREFRLNRRTIIRICRRYES
jgi:hypothetical protein